MSLSAVMICSVPHLVPFTFLSSFYSLIFSHALFQSLVFFTSFQRKSELSLLLSLAWNADTNVGFHSGGGGVMVASMASQLSSVFVRERKRKS